MGMRKQNMISEALRELKRAQSIEDPIKRVAAFRELIPRLREIAYLIKDRTIIDTINRFMRIEEESRAFYEVKFLKKLLEDLKKRLQSTRSFLPSDTIDSFLICIEQFNMILTRQQHVFQPSVEAMFLTIEQLTHQLIGRRLEKEITPSLLKQMGYKLGPTIYRDNNTEIEIDALGEKTKTSAPEGQGRILLKEILIVECKASITKEDIIDFLKKIKVIKEKYEQIAHVLGHKLKVNFWIIACYGWTDELKNFSIEKGIKPIDKEELENLLRNYGLLDRRLPVCPEKIETS